MRRGHDQHLGVSQHRRAATWVGERTLPTTTLRFSLLFRE